MFRGIRGVSPEEEKEGYGGNDLQKRKVLSLEWKNGGVINDESGESMEPMEEVPLIGLGESELEKINAWLTERSRVIIIFPFHTFSYFHYILIRNQ